MTSDSFYVHLAISPCSRYLASGSSDHGVYLFDTEGPENGGVKLNGHEKETLSLDWSQDKVSVIFTQSESSFLHSYLVLSL